jgi:hypothetical protein
LEQTAKLYGKMGPVFGKNGLQLEEILLLKKCENLDDKTE